MPTVSVITIFLNEEAFIEEAITSVLAQTYNDWELLLVDDGSRDRSSSLAKKFADHSPHRVRYLEHPEHQNLGMSASRNLGLRYALGEYIAFLDADDVWMPYKLAEQVALLESHPEAGAVCGATLYWFGWTGCARDAQEDVVHLVGGTRDVLGAVDPAVQQLKGLVYPSVLATQLYPLGRGSAPSMSNLMLRRAMINRVGGFENQFTGLYEDQAFLIKLYFHAVILITERCWDKYRQHPESCCAAALRDNYRTYRSVRYSFLRWLKEYLLQSQFNDTAVWSATQDALWPYRHPVRAWIARAWRARRAILARALRKTLSPAAFHWLRARFAQEP